MLGFPQNFKSSFVLHVTAFMENYVAFDEQVHKLKWLKSYKAAFSGNYEAKKIP